MAAGITLRFDGDTTPMVRALKDAGGPINQEATKIGKEAGSQAGTMFGGQFKSMILRYLGPTILLKAVKDAIEQSAALAQEAAQKGMTAKELGLLKVMTTISGKSESDIAAMKENEPEAYKILRAGAEGPEVFGSEQVHGGFKQFVKNWGGAAIVRHLGYGGIRAPHGSYEQAAIDMRAELERSKHNALKTAAALAGSNIPIGEMGSSVIQQVPYGAGIAAQLLKAQLDAVRILRSIDQKAGDL